MRGRTAWSGEDVTHLGGTGSLSAKYPDSDSGQREPSAGERLSNKRVQGEMKNNEGVMGGCTHTTGLRKGGEMADPVPKRRRYAERHGGRR